MANKKKVILYGDSPLADTGLGNLHKPLLRALYDTGNYEITVVPLNHFVFRLNAEQKDKYPYEFVTSTHPQDLTWNTTVFKTLLQNDAWDLIITSHDFNKVAPFVDEIMVNKQKHGGKWINLYPIDRACVDELEARLLSSADLNLTYSMYAEIMTEKLNPKADIRTLWLPVDTNVFRPIGGDLLEKFRTEYLGFDTKHFLVTNVNRGLPRKDMGATVEAFGLAYQTNKNLRLYIHAYEDLNVIIERTIRRYKLPRDIIKTAATLKSGTPAMGIPQQVLSMIYNASDLIISTSTGEGYGYSVVEAMACGKQVLAPNNTSFPELLANDRGVLSPVLGEVWTYADSTVTREPVDIVKFAENIVKLSKSKVATKTESVEFVNNNMSIQAFTQKWLRHIDQLLK